MVKPVNDTYVALPTPPRPKPEFELAYRQIDGSLKLQTYVRKVTSAELKVALHRLRQGGVRSIELTFI